MKSEVIVNEGLRTKKRSLQRSLKKFTADLSRREYSILTDSSLHILGHADMFRALVMSLEKYDSSLKNLVINSCYRLNEKCPIVVPAYLHVLNEILYDQTKVQRYDKLFAGLRPRRVPYEEAEEQWNSSVSDNDFLVSTDVLSIAMKEAGALGNVSIRKSKVFQGLKTQEGIRVSCGLNKFFESSINEIELTNAIIIVIDGVILEVGEIHHLLQHAYETKQAVVLFATGYSDDVSNTLLVNWQNNNTKILPFKIQDSLSNINEIKDICEISGIMPVCKDTGLLISGIDFFEQRRMTVNYSIKSGDCFLKINRDDFMRVNALKHRVQQKLHNETVSDVRDLLEKRISKLSSRRVVLYLDFEDSDQGIIEERAASFFQFMTQCARQGVLTVPSAVKECSFFLPDFLPAVDFTTAVEMAIADARSIGNIRAIIKLDR